MTTPLSRRPGVPTLALAAAALLAAAAAACAPTGPGDDPTCPSHGQDPVRPTNGKMLGFALYPKTISYHFLDVRVDTVEYTWDTSYVYAGFACLRFQTTDSVHINPSGAFQLLLSGSNGAYLHRHLTGGGVTTNDSIIGYVFSGCEGTGGTYQLQADNSLSLNWTDGQQSLILSPTGLNQLKGDTIWSSVTVSTHADSLRGAWRLAWLRSQCGEGF
jgi:hypothetical protein